MEDEKQEYFTKVFEKYSNMVYRIGLTYLKSKSDAEDIGSEVFVKPMQKSSAFESDEHEKAWIIKVTVNMCKNVLKSKWFQRVNYDDSIGSYF